MSKVGVPIQSTAGAVPMKNDKGEFTMQKVKVSRYVSGKRPDYAPQESSDEEDDFEIGINQKKSVGLPQVKTEAEKDDRRLRRLKERHEDDDDAEDRITRHRRVHEPEVLDRSSDEEDDEDMEREQLRRQRIREAEDEESSEEDEELDEEEIVRRRELLRQKAKQQQQQEEELMDVEDEKSEEGSEEESSEYEEYTDSEEEETGPRLKPVFVRKKDRITIQEKEKEALKERELEVEAKKMIEERRRQTLKMVEDEARKQQEVVVSTAADPCDSVLTDEDNDEEEYEGWKVRELKRMKRDREERENLEKERLEAERLRNMTEEERRQEIKNNPKQVTNKAPKGKYKFLQKYYHRGAFFMDAEQEVFKRDFSGATLEDQFDKTILPKVMQVKNFGRSGRTKYTHLVDQDTSHDSPWQADSAQNLKFHANKGGGMKQSFDKPAAKRRK